jgi:hypothetical protein
MPASERKPDMAQQTPQETSAGESPAWEMIDVGRYQPRRIRGSCRGRVLG